MMYLGDFATGQTVYVYFNTFDSNDPSGSVTITGLAVTDIEIYKNGSVTQRSSDSGYTLLDTDGIDFDSITGVHGFCIDLSDNTDAGFFAAGGEYMVAVAGIVVDGADPVNFIAATFSIERTNGAIAQLKAMLDGNNRVDVGSWLGTAVTTSATTSLPEVDAKSISDNAAAADNVQANIGNLDAPISIAQADLDIITDTDGVILGAAGVDLIWDEPLTAAAHNVVNSAGRRLRTLEDFGVYEGGYIWIDTVNGTAGTTDFENGTVNNPVASIADAITLAASVGLPGFHFLPGSSVTLAASMDNYEFTGENYTVALGGQSISGCSFYNATITGNDDGTNTVAPKFVRCNFTDSTLGLHVLIACAMGGTTTGITLAEAGTYYWDACYSGVAGTGTPKVTFGAGNQNLNMRHWSGGIQIENMGASASTDNMSVEGFGQVVEGTCTAGTVAVRGAFTTSGITNLTLSDAARFDTANTIDANTVQISGSATAANNLEASALGIIPGTAQTGTLSTTVMTSDLTGYADDELIGRVVVWTGGTAAGQASEITDYASTNGTVTYNTITTAPVNNDTFVIV